MLFMVMHKVNEEMESGGRPDKELITRMGKLIGETIKNGQLHNAAGLKRSAERVRVRRSGGEVSVTQGPLRGDNELLASFTMMAVKSMDEAVAWTQRIAEALGDVEIDIGPVVERWDLGMGERPENPPLKALALVKGDAATEAGVQLAPAKAAKLDTVMGELQKAGALLAAERLGPSSGGARLRRSGGKQAWMDGPFAESKELIAGFTIVKLDTLAEAKAWTERYAEILGDCEVDVQEVR